MKTLVAVLATLSKTKSAPPWRALLENVMKLKYLALGTAISAPVAMASVDAAKVDSPTAAKKEKSLVIPVDQTDLLVGKRNNRPAVDAVALDLTEAMTRTKTFIG